MSEYFCRTCWKWHTGEPVIVNGHKVCNRKKYKPLTPGVEASRKRSYTTGAFRP